MDKIVKKIRKIKNKAGFTLIEVIIITLILGILGVAALTNYITTTRTFNFLAAEKSIASALRVARAYSATNKAVKIDGEQFVPDRYGILIEQKGITTFADVGATPFYFDASAPSDYILINKSFDFTDTSYEIVFWDSAQLAITLPALIFFEKESSEMTVFGDVKNNHDLISKMDHKHITLRFEDIDRDIIRYIVIFQLSGLSEGFKEMPPN
ncbi:prepilin-type N-terminal cleavage/methylation domain-containing protein [Patescibacteria group bacterium]